MTMITRSVGSLCTQSSDLPQCQCACALAHSLSGEHVHNICKKQLSWKNCASLVPLGMKWACICAGNGVFCLVVFVMCLCLVVFGCVWLCECWRYYVIVCVVFVVLLPSMRWLLCGDDGSKKKKDVCNFKKHVPRWNLSPLRFKLIRKNFFTKKTH